MPDFRALFSQQQETPDFRSMFAPAPEWPAAEPATNAFPASGGLTVAPKGGVPRQAEQPSQLADLAKSFLAGTERAGIGLVGLPGDIGNLMRSLAGIEGPRPTGLTPTSQQVTNAVESATGQIYEPKTVPGQYAETVGEFLPAAIGPGGAVRKAAEVVLPAVVSETAGQATKGTNYEALARIGGAVAGGFAPSVLRRAVTPLPANRAATEASRALQAEGVQVTAGQATGNKGLKYAESELGGRRTGQLIENQNEQFTRAASRRIGLDTPHLDGATMEQAYRQIGGVFQNVAARNQLRADNTLHRAAYNAVGDYMRRTPQSQRIPLVEEQAREILALNGQVPGDVYQSMRSALGDEARRQTDEKAQHALYQLQRALDDSFERSLRGTANEADIGLLRDARRQYRNYLVLEDAMATGGQETAAGILTPAKLEQAAARRFGKRAYLHGSEFTELAKSGKIAMSKMPESGTSARAAARLVPAAIGAAAGGASTGGDWRGFVAGAVAPWAAGRVLMSRPAQAYLRNQLLAQPTNRNVLARAGVNALLARP